MTTTHNPSEGKKHPLDGDISVPPTEAELKSYQDRQIHDLRGKSTRDPHKRIFINRDLNLDEIKFYGFDMDHTLAVFTDAMPVLVYKLIKEVMIDFGYPKALSSLEFDPKFAIRGLFLDKDLGNLLKVDNFRNIIGCVHGRNVLSKSETEKLYPTMRIVAKAIDTRFYMLNTLFTLPEACIYADFIHYLENHPEINISAAAAKNEFDDQKLDPKKVQVNFTNLFQDIRVAVGKLHTEGILKPKMMEDLGKYFVKDPKTSEFLLRLRANGIKVFLLTNSKFKYANEVMKYLLDGVNPKYPSWRDYFDVMVVSAEKKNFFSEGITMFREVDLDSGTCKINTVHSFEKGRIYQAGSLEVFHKLMGAKGDDILYVGDHIFSDIMKSKKVHGWRSLFIVPELDHELSSWIKNKGKYDHMVNLEFIKSEIYHTMELDVDPVPDLSILLAHIKRSTEAFDAAFNKYFGSLFRSGSCQSFFAEQVERYSDIYTANVLNLLEYPVLCQFTSSATLLHHERSASGDAAGDTSQ